MKKQWDDNKTYHLKIWICGRCLNGAGGECHTPDCAFCRHAMDILHVYRELCEVIETGPSDTVEERE